MPRLVVRPAPTIWLGPAMVMVIGLAVAILVASDPVTLLVALPFVAAAISYGVCELRPAVVCDDHAMTVRNRFRTLRLAWEDVADVGFVGRPEPVWWVNMGDRQCGFVRRADGKPIFMDATDSYQLWPYGHLLSMSPAQAQERLAKVGGFWALKRTAT